MRSASSLNESEAQIVQVRGRASAFALYVMATMPFGIILHLGAESGALGLHSLTPDFFHRHIYLAILGFLVLFFGKQLLASYTIENRLQIHALRRHLPYQGQGWQFFGLGYFLQFGFFGLTLVAEQAPPTHADWGLGSLIALALATAGSAIIASLPEQIVKLFSGWYLRRERRGRIVRSELCTSTQTTRHLWDTGYRTTLGNRPPPNIGPQFLFA